MRSLELQYPIGKNRCPPYSRLTVPLPTPGACAALSL